MGLADAWGARCADLGVVGCPSAAAGNVPRLPPFDIYKHVCVRIYLSFCGDATPFYSILRLLLPNSYLNCFFRVYLCLFFVLFPLLCFENTLILNRVFPSCFVRPLLHYVIFDDVLFYSSFTSVCM